MVGWYGDLWGDMPIPYNFDTPDLRGMASTQFLMGLQISLPSQPP